MSIENPIVPFPAEEETAPLTTTFSQEEANYFLHVVDFNRELITGVIENVSPRDLPALLAFLQSVLETQVEEARGAFDEQRIFWNTIYPAVLHNNLAEHPEENGDFVVVIPTPRGLAIDTFSEPSRIISPSGSRLIN